MHRKLILAATIVAGAGAVALADAPVLRTPPGLNAPTGLSAPSGLNAFGAGIGECAIPRCAAADADCGAIAFEAAATCLQLGALANCEDCEPPVETTFFQARGGGVVLYGAVGAGSQRRALERLREAIVAE